MEFIYTNQEEDFGNGGMKKITFLSFLRLIHFEAIAFKMYSKLTQELGYGFFTVRLISEASFLQTERTLSYYRAESVN